MRIYSLDLRAIRRNQRNQLESHPFQLGDYAPGLLTNIPGLLKKVRCVFQRVTPADLGYEQGAEWSLICKSARRQGLSFVPQKFIPSLRLEYVEQEVNDFVRIAHHPINGQSKRSYRFCLHNDGKSLWLRGREHGGNSAHWPGDFNFLFMEGYVEIED